MLSKRERSYGLDMDALVTVCSRNTRVNYYVSGKDALVSGCDALETQTSFWFGHGCSRERMLSKRGRYYGLDMDALVSGCSRNTHVNYYGSGKDALVSGCSRNTNVIMVQAWVLW